MIPFIRRHSVASYLALAFAMSWGGIFLVIRGGSIPAPPAEAERLFVGVYLAMLVGPSLAGVLMTYLVGGRDALRDYGRRLMRWHVAPRWYGIAILTAPVALGLTAAALVPLSSAFAPALLRSGPLDPAAPMHASGVGLLMLLGLGVGLGAGFFEELGWTGFAIPRLLERRGAVSTGILLGVVWGAWHFVAIFWGSAASFDDVPVAVYMLVALFTFLIPYRVLMVRVYERTQSLLVAMLMHAALTSSMIILGPAITGTRTLVYNLTFALILWVFVAGAAMKTKNQRRYPRASSATVLTSLS